jgi:hypothetical protein
MDPFVSKINQEEIQESRRIPSGDLNFTSNKDLLPGRHQSSPALSFGSLGNLLFSASTFSMEIFFFF